ncbi:MAG: L,D-transpeptidase family protein [Clostridium sp.]|uniref:L,D-transpeptidase family protein n=1 Tax=Clostridium sp. TaxID=1506 RepID=UPI003D6D4A29
MENELEKSIIKPIKKHRKVIKRILISIFVFLVLYFGMSIYFMNHFYFGSAINSISVSGKVVEDANKKMATEIKTYKITIKERGGKTEQISGDEVGLEYDSDGEFKEFKESQNPYKWISSVFNTKDSKMIEGIKYDTELLKKSVDNLSCFDNKNIIEPKNASYKYTNKGYVIVDEVIGNKGNKENLYNKVIDAVGKGETTIDLESINYYVKPQYTSKSQKTLETKEILNKYVASKITYTFGKEKELLEASTINKWLRVDANSNVTFDEKEVGNYINVLSNKYNTVGNSRNFVRTSGKIINIAVGDYGWYINKSMETQDLIANIKEGKSISKEPKYSQTALFHGSNDMGNTYVELDMSAQHLWFYKNGAIVTHGDVVTGKLNSEGTATPAGIYKLKYKEKDAILKGKNYASPVTYWMPFNGNVGIHDASWRNTFGGNIYKKGGSHGCVNSPFELAKAVFENINVGTPVVCYY